MRTESEWHLPKNEVLQTISVNLYLPVDSASGIFEQNSCDLKNKIIYLKVIGNPSFHKITL